MHDGASHYELLDHPSDGPSPTDEAMDRARGRPIQLASGLGLQRVFHASDAYVWKPIALWGGVFVAGCFARRLLQVRGAGMMGLASACFRLGMMDVLGYGAKHYVDETIKDESLRPIFTVAVVYTRIARDTHKVAAILHTLPQYDPRYVTPRGPDITPDEPLSSRILQQISWWKYHAWSSPTDRTYMRHCYQQEMEAAHISPHDIDICTTYFAHAVVMKKWDTLSTAVLINMAGSFVVELCTTRPWLAKASSRLFDYSWWILLVSSHLRSYYSMSSLHGLEDKAGVAMFFRNKYPPLREI
ncbi:hypothetical protein B0H21DRAFT_753326 [Amylocystis lapponica]|nr:hypothetical protein B0H21DRAFT_753326 [Amylocystis lapponica]